MDSKLLKILASLYIKKQHDQAYSHFPHIVDFPNKGGWAHTPGIYRLKHEKGRPFTGTYMQIISQRISKVWSISNGSTPYASFLLSSIMNGKSYSGIFLLIKS